MGSTTDAEHLTMWFNKWEVNDTIWHKNEVKTHLVKHFDRIRKIKDEKREFNVFVPLCGKTLDIKWLLEKGCSVVGVEGVDKPVIELFKQHNLSYKTTTLSKEDTLYQCEELPLKIYKCNVFDFPKYNNVKFDMVWDRASFVAINTQQRERYAVLMKGLYAPTFFHLLEAYDYDCATVLKHPNSLSFSVVKDLLGDAFMYEQLEDEDCKEVFMKIFKVEFSYAYLKVLLICRK